MAGAIYDLSTLLQVQRVQKSLPKFWLDFFPSAINFDTDEILWDKVYQDDRRLAPFVVPNVKGVPMGDSGYSTISFKPAYIKQKDTVDPTKPFKRMAGETLGSGSMSPQQRYDALVAQILANHRTYIENRWEWMAAKALIDGQITIAGENYPSRVVNFRRSAELSVVLTGAAKWDQNTGNPLSDIKTARVAANYRSGARIRRCIFGQNAWDLFTARVDLRAQMQTQIDGYGTRVTMLADGFEGMEYMGVVQGLDGSGRIECWVNTQKYVDENNVEQFMMDQSTVVGLGDSAAIKGVRCFGAIKDKQANFQPLSIFPKMWTEEDPAADFMMSQSAPLMVPVEPNATFSIKVA